MYEIDTKIATLSKNKNYVELRELLKNKIKLNPQEEKWRYYLALTYFADDMNVDVDLSEGTKILDELVKKFPDVGQYRFWLSYIYFYLCPSEEEKWCKEFEQIVPMDMPNELKAYTHMFLAEHETTKGNLVSALEHIETSLGSIPNIARSLIAKADILFRIGEEVRARNILFNKLFGGEVFYDTHNPILEDMINTAINDAIRYNKRNYSSTFLEFADLLIDNVNRHLTDNKYQHKHSLRYLLMALEDEDSF